uniref:Neurotransmitter-gated ion-channel ligand-binding domain-containing protein n=1 Tax=Biomphalaria glabrata TaxID=6526 RepID=A0A2C9KAA8_BIOGL
MVVARPMQFLLLLVYVVHVTSANNNFRVPYNYNDDPNMFLTDEQRLLKALTTNYDPAVRPVYNSKQAVLIRLGITLTQIIDVVWSFRVVLILSNGSLSIQEK